ISVSGCSMWLPMWVFDGNGFTMACLAVWIRNVALRWGVAQWRGGQERWMRRHPTAPVSVAPMSVARSGTDFIAPNPGERPTLPLRESALSMLGRRMSPVRGYAAAHTNWLKRP